MQSQLLSFYLDLFAAVLLHVILNPPENWSSARSIKEFKSFVFLKHPDIVIGSLYTSL